MSELAKHVWYRAPIFYSRPMLTEEEQATESYSYTTKYAYKGKGQVSANGEPYDQETPGVKRGKNTMSFTSIERADWYNHDDDTCLCVLHAGMSAPAGWEGPLDRETFLAYAEAAGFPSVKNAEAVWALEEIK